MSIAQPITVNGVMYKSLNEASIATGIERKTLKIKRELQGNSIEYVSNRKPPSYRTLEKIQEIAKKCSTRAEFWKTYKGAAIKAQRQGWLDQIYGHMEFVKQEKGYWQSIKNVRDAANQCETRSEFQKKFPAAWYSAKENEWLDEISKQMVVRKSSGEYIVKKFLISHDIKSESQKKFPDCKDKRPLPFDEYLPELKILIEIQGVQHKKGWGQKDASFQYIYMHDQIKKNYAISNGFRFIEIWDTTEKNINNILQTQIHKAAADLNMPLTLKKRALTDEEKFELETMGQWTFEKVKLAALKCSSPKEFQNKYSSAYAKAHKMGWADELFDHMTRALHPKGYWTKERLIEVALKFQVRSDFQKEYVGAYNVARTTGVLDEICSHMTKLRVPSWTKESIKEVITNCSKYSEFKSKYPSAYNVARKQGWLAELRINMSRGQLPHGYWNNLQRVLEVAKQCSSRSEFQEKFGSARNAAKKNGWMNLVCSHMR